MNDENDQSKAKAKGGLARANKLSPQERSEIAAKAARARWGETGNIIYEATHEGVIRIGDAELSCYVLKDGQRILSTRGVMKSLERTWRGRKYSGTQLPVFLEAKNLNQFINNSLDLVPRMLKTTSGSIAEGYPAEILPAVCDVYLAARKDGKLTPRQYSIANRCEILVRSFAKVGIIALIDEATGYQEIRPSDALQAYLDKVLRRELAAWAKKFPDEFYKNIYALKKWPWPGMKKNRFSIVAHYTRDLVYERLGPGILRELEARTPKNDNGNRKHKMHQWLTEDIGDPLLAQHLHSLIMFQRLAIANGYGWNRFLKTVDQVMPRRGATMELPLNDPDAYDPSES